MRKILVILFLGLGYFVYDLLMSAGYFKTIKNQFEGDVIAVYDTMPGPEDLDVDVSTSTMYISSDDRWANRGGDEVSGGIFRLNLDSLEDQPMKMVRLSDQGTFHPHGISYFEQDSAKYLFVINHTQSGDFVERHLIQGDTLIHQVSFENPMMCCPNDLVAVGKDQFYVTNDHGNKAGFMRKVEDYLRVAMSYVLFYDRKEFKKVAEGLNYANGINVSADQSKLYLTGTTSGMFYTYNRNKSSGELSLTHKVDLETGVDNIHVDVDGSVWIGCHPKLLDFVGHSKSSENKSPSQVLKLTPKETGYKVEEVYLDDGRELSGSSVAVPYKDELFIGVVFEKKVLRGKLY